MLRELREVDVTSRTNRRLQSALVSMKLLRRFYGDRPADEFRALDSEGNLLLTGHTDSDNSSGWISGGFDTELSGQSDAFAMKLNNTQITDAGLQHLKGMTSLLWLNLASTQITGPGLAHLKGLTSLHILILNITQITDADLEHIKELTELRTLNLGYTQITDAGLKYLKGLTRLKELHLDNTQVTDAGVKKLQEALPKCRIHH